MFVDSDDYVANTFIEKLSMGFVDESVDISCCAYLRFTDGETPKIQSIEEKELILSGEECIKYCYSKDGRKIDIVAWNKMYKKSLFDKNKILYPKGKYFEDLYTTYKLFFYSNKISINTSELYFYRNRTGSIMTTPMTKEKYDNILEGLKDSLFFFENNEKKELVSLAFSMYGRTIIRTYYNSRKIKSKKIRNEIQFLLFNDYKKTYNNFKKKINISFVKKVVFTFFYYFPKIISQVIK